MAKKYWTYKGRRMPAKKYIPPRVPDDEKLFRQLIRKTGQANERLRRIKKEFGTLGWAGEVLKNKTSMHLINAWTSKGIRVKSTMSKMQQKATLKAIENFLNSKTSTVKGIRQTIRKQQEGIRSVLATENTEITVEESKTLYSFFEDRDFLDMTEYIGASELFILLDDAKDRNDTPDNFIDRISMYVLMGNDEDMKEKLKKLYTKYVRS